MAAATTMYHLLSESRVDGPTARALLQVVVGRMDEAEPLDPSRIVVTAEDVLLLEPTDPDPAYQTPLQLAGRSDPKAGLYGLGCVLFELVTGRRFGPTTPVLKGHERRRQAALGDLGHIDPELAAHIHVLLASDPLERPGVEVLARWAGPLDDPGRACLATLAGPTETIPTVPGTMDRYLDLGPLGSGGMGEVRLVLDRELGRRVAMKIGRSALERTLQGRFAAEVQTTARLQHPGIVPIYDAGQLLDGRPFYTMKQVRGHTLTDEIDALHRDPVQPAFRDHIGIFLAVCDAVAYAHAAGIIHRDLKPDNVMLGEFGEALVLDWGIAKVFGGSSEPGDIAAPATATMEGSLLGTPAYMAPEQVAGEIVLDARADVYALGAILYQLISGRPPYAGTAAEVLDAVRTKPAQPPDLRPFGEVEPLLGALAVICTRAMARDRRERIEDAAALRRLVAGWLLDARHLDQIYALRQQAEAALGRFLAIDRDREATPEVVASVLDGARFALRRALDAAPDDPEVITAYRTLIGAAVRHYLDREQPVAARTLLLGVPGEHPALRAQVEQVLQARARDTAELQARRHHEDPGRDRPRAIGMPIAVGSVLGIGALTLAVGVDRGWLQADYPRVWSFVGIGTIGTAIAIRTVQLRQINAWMSRQTSYLMVTNLCIPVLFAVCQLAGLPVLAAGSILEVYTGAMVLALGAFTGLRYWPSGLVFLIGGVAMALLPVSALWILAAAMAVGFASLIWTATAPPRPLVQGSS